MMRLETRKVKGRCTRLCLFMSVVDLYDKCCCVGRWKKLFGNLCLWLAGCSQFWLSILVKGEKVLSFGPTKLQRHLIGTSGRVHDIYTQCFTCISLILSKLLQLKLYCGRIVAENAAGSFRGFNYVA
jgi:hypothetical protein